MRATLGPRTPSDAHTPQGTFYRSAGALSRGGGDGAGRAGEGSGGGVRGGGRRPSLAAMAAEEVAQATRRWQQWSGAAASKLDAKKTCTKCAEAVASGLPTCHFEGPPE
eukprot:6182770-Prymnesium_polylepis.1